MLRINFKDFEVFRLRVREKWLNQFKNFWWGDRLDSRFLALYYLKGLNGKKVLDVGCSCGVALEELSCTNLKVGFDMSTRLVKIAKELNNNLATILRADMHHIPAKCEAFDEVMLFGMLEVLPTIEDKKRCLNEILRVLKKEGELVITAQNKNYFCPLDKTNKVDYGTLKSLLTLDWDYKIFGFNPVPSFPYFLPNFIQDKIPFIWRVLVYLMNRDMFVNRCRSFIVIAKKK